ncbi:MAG: DegT/DnrJ/EryC1/StrS aminotransferase family protein [Holosporales bacterium]|jgi:dTDP-4-amino-4,6-dideoxygalactose transaminase|nr:DegT/DnrJ/EryC1/StrS aminotransferase family protein [Holosporales bacterium]
MTSSLRLCEIGGEPVPYIDLKSQQDTIRPQIDAAIARVLNRGLYIMVPEIQTLEEALSDFCGAKHAITCANGTDALSLGLLALGVNPGDAVFVPSFTFAATAEAVVLAGATPIFVDVLPNTYNIDPESLCTGLQTARASGLRPVGVIPVDIFGQPADYAAIDSIAQEHDLWIIADAAQSFGAYYKDRSVGTLAPLTTTSFFPAKPLGCYGDGGAVFTNDDTLADLLRSLRVHGAGAHKYDNVRIGMNGRLDTLQAAILLEKLKIFPQELKRRQQIADFYTRHLKDCVRTPALSEETSSSWAQYTICLDKGINRDHVIADLKTYGVPTMIYYVKPLHQQTAYKTYPTAGNGQLPVSEDLSMRVLSLPMSGYVTQPQAERVVDALRKVVKGEK